MAIMSRLPALSLVLVLLACRSPLAGVQDSPALLFGGAELVHSTHFELPTSGLRLGTYRFRMEIFPESQLPTATIHSSAFVVVP